MKIEKIGVQGDVLFLRIDAIPEDAKPRPETEEYTIAHSETGHHHVARTRGRHVTVYDDASDPMASYIEFRGGMQPIEHLRSWDTHATVELLERSEATVDAIDAVLDAEPTRFKILRQRQMTPEGWQRVVD